MLVKNTATFGNQFAPFAGRAFGPVFLGGFGNLNGMFNIIGITFGGAPNGFVGCRV